MSTERRHGPASPGRTRRSATLAGALAAVSLMLFAWPLVRVPPLDVTPAFVHVFAVWSVVVVVLWWLSRRLASNERRSRGRPDA